MNRTVYVDVDDTFVRSFGSKRIAIAGTIRRIRELRREGAHLYCWSSGGAEYARDSAAEFDIEDCFVGLLPKPQVLIDDQRVGEWRNLVQLHPNEAATRDRAAIQMALGWV